MSETAGVVGDGGGLGCHGVMVCGEHPNHLDIVAEVCREIEVADWLDQQEPSHRQYVSVGTARVAMALNGLGFSNRRLYLTPQFYADKPDGLPLVAQFVGQLLCQIEQQGGLSCPWCSQDEQFLSASLWGQRIQT